MIGSVAKYYGLYYPLTSSEPTIQGMRFKQLPILLISTILGWLAYGLICRDYCRIHFRNGRVDYRGCECNGECLTVGSGIPEAYHSSINKCVYLGCDDTGLNDLGDAITDNDYMTFLVTPDSGYAIKLTSLTLKAGYSNSRANTKSAGKKRTLQC